MGITAGIAAVGGSLISGSMQADAATSAAQTQAQSAQAASQLQYQEFLTQQQNLQPWLQAGQGALSTLQAGLQPGGQFNTPFSMAQFQQDPGYNFQKQQGQAAINARGAAAGTYTSPATTQALSQFNQGLANTSYNDAYNRYMQTTGRTLAATQSLANVGQTATSQLNAAGTNMTNAISSNTIGAGNAQAAGQVGSANAWGSALSQGGQVGLNAYTMSQYGGTQSTPYSFGPTGDPSGGAAGPQALTPEQLAPIDMNMSSYYNPPVPVLS